MRRTDRNARCIAAAETSAHPLLIFIVVSLMTVLGIVEAEIHREALTGFHFATADESQFLGP